MEGQGLGGDHAKLRNGQMLHFSLVWYFYCFLSARFCFIWTRLSRNKILWGYFPGDCQRIIVKEMTTLFSAAIQRSFPQRRSRLALVEKQNFMYGLRCEMVGWSAVHRVSRWHGRIESVVILSGSREAVLTWGLNSDRCDRKIDSEFCGSPVFDHENKISVLFGNDT